ncbi:cyclin-dependent protein kinase inhibitor SMR9-like [Momordica charantia]|uniref:Cyclin-dependent protein kinase inhibitor SMR9-like n=1 Tax=Momordica charantia TaxID=3673 RepID=A0A6J1DK32_MOMCH|nr:cyclin-dependent protein kinase inhibitor SMR9-like [Momordica charantia]
MASKGGIARTKMKMSKKIKKKSPQRMKKRNPPPPSPPPKNQETETETAVELASSSAAMAENESMSSDLEECCTPKAERFRIPEIKICPPAPKKQRIFSNCSNLQRPSPIAFFASPDIELFFFFSSSQ